MAIQDPYAKDDDSTRLGFQKSETSGVEVQIFSHKFDPLLISQDSSSFGGKSPRDGKPTVISAQTTKSMGAGAGTFMIEVKCVSREAEQILNGFQDDDWVDITFTRHSRKWHVMRGLVDSIQETGSISGNGATARTYTITGRDFTKIWEQTTLWYDIFAAKPQGLDAVSELTVFGRENLSGMKPVDLIDGFMFDLFREQLRYGRGTWLMPDSMRGRNVQEKFIDSITKIYDGHLTGWLDGMERITVGLGSLATIVGNYFWDFLKEYSDPPFCELFTDVYPNGDFPQPGDEARPENSEMVVIFRDRPFLTVDTTDIQAPFPGGKDSPWYKLPVFIVPRSQIGSGEVLVRSGAERYNSFQATGGLIQESSSQNTNIAAKPLWHLDDILLHGLRRYDVSTRYVAFSTNDYVQNKTNRAITRDWYALNAYYRSGQIPLSIGRPDIRIGTRIRVPGNQRPQSDFDAYVEMVTHNWSFGRGLRTTLGVTRGWRGGDDDMQNKLQQLVEGYSTAGDY